MAAPTKMENRGEDGTNTRQDPLGDNQELDTEKKISEMEKTNEKLLKKEEGYKKKAQQLGGEVDTLNSKIEDRVHHLQGHEPDLREKSRNGENSEISSKT